jgi:hypothetical protein
LRRAIAIAIGTAALLACATEAERPDDAGPPTIEIGGGATAFEMLPSGGEPDVELVSGLQGGWHLDLGARLRGFERGAITIEYEVVRVEDGASLVRLPVRLGASGLAVEADGALTRWGDRAIFDVGSPSEVVGARVELRARATADGGRVAEDARVVRIVDTVDELP